MVVGGGGEEDHLTWKVKPTSVYCHSLASIYLHSTTWLAKTDSPEGPPNIFALCVRLKVQIHIATKVCKVESLHRQLVDGGQQFKCHFACLLLNRTQQRQH